jgi:protein-glutamine gamma-glutamyltransferase
VNHYLHQGFSYSERPAPIPKGRAPLDGFLFDTKEGYCQHFSGAMALLLRMGGIPARVATGFSPGGYSQRYKAWIVRDTDAHAWVEAWYDNIGWVTYDPTPAETPARSQIFAIDDTPPPPVADSGSAGGVAGGGAGARKSGNFLRPDLAQDRQAGAGGAGAPAARRDGGVPWWAWTLAVLAVAALIAWVVARVRRGRDSRTPLERSVAELEAALRRAGRPQPTGTTLRQLEKLFGGSPDAVGYLRALSAGRYGPVQAPPTPAQRRQLRRALGDGLGWWGRLRAWWALPPRGR